jgi:hypothetical protein
MNRKLLCLAAAASFILGLWTAPAARSQNPAPRFDHQVRDDIFAGFAGDAAALARGLAVAAEVLKAQPDHAEAMVWLGSGRAFESGQLFQKGDFASGMKLWTEALELMNRAVILAPDHVGVRIPRAATLASASREMPPDMARPLIETALADYRKVYELQGDAFDKLSDHARGELLLGLADLAERAGASDPDWRVWARKAAETLPANSPYQRRAASWLEKDAIGAGQRTCLGCHTGAQ